MTVEFCYLVFITADYYALNHYIVPEYLVKKKYAHFFISVLLLVGFSAWLRALIALQMNRHYFGNPMAAGFDKLFFNSLINISIWVLLLTMGKMLADKIQTQRQLESLGKERIRNELDYLKAQINPHALFNSLNTIYGHIDKNNQAARNILLQFSELLRYQLYDCGAEKVKLTEEMEYIKNYIAFQRLRKDEKLTVHMEMGRIDSQLEIAPLLLVVLIENAFKFVSNYSCRENSICIKINTTDNILFCSFTNTIDLTSTGNTKDSGGIGIANLKRRLELLYKGKYEITMDNDGEIYQTLLTIDLG